MLQSARLPVQPLVPNVETAPHIQGLREGRLIVPRCDDCGVVIWYPRAFCPDCGDTNVSWQEIEARGRVYSSTVVRKGSVLFDDYAPYVLAYVELDDGPRVMTNVIGAVDAVEIGSVVVGVYEAEGDGDPILRFELESLPPSADSGGER
jgi:uncharacterized OB-fold protein